MLSARQMEKIGEYILKSSPPPDVAVKITAEMTNERLEGSLEDSLPVKPHSVYTTIFAPQFSQYVIDFDPREVFYVPNTEDTNSRLQKSKSKRRYVFNGINFKYYKYGYFDDDENLKKYNELYISDNSRMLGFGEYADMYIGKYFFPSELPFLYSHDPSQSKSMGDALTLFLSKDGFSNYEMSDSNGELTLKCDVGPHVECVFSTNPLMLKSCKRVYKSDNEEYTVSYEFSGKIALPWSDAEIPNKFVRTAFSTADKKGHRETAILKSIEIVKDFDIKNYDQAPEKGWTVYDRIKGLTYKIGDTKEDILKSIMDADKE